MKLFEKNPLFFKGLLINYKCLSPYYRILNIVEKNQLVTLPAALSWESHPDAAAENQLTTVVSIYMLIIMMVVHR